MLSTTPGQLLIRYNLPIISTRSWFIGFSVLFALLWGVLLSTRLIEPASVTFQSDAREYSLVAVHLLQDGMYSLDGITSTAEREPGYSFFLASVYGIFGIENRIAVYFMQGLLYLIASVFFAREFRKIT